MLLGLGLNTTLLEYLVLDSRVSSYAKDGLDFGRLVARVDLYEYSTRYK